MPSRWHLSVFLLVVVMLVGGDCAFASDAAADPKIPGLIPQKDQALWALVVFVAFATLMRLFAWGPLRDALDQREAKIKGDLDAARETRLKSEEMLKNYKLQLDQAHEEVKEMLAEGRRDSERMRQELLAASEKEVQAMRQRAVSEIEQARDVALNELMEAMSRQVVTATERIVRRSLTSDDQERLVRVALSELDIRRN